MRLADKTVLLVGGGQAEGETIGNGRAAAVRFAQEGARVLVADRDLAAANATVGQIERAGGTAVATYIDVTDESTIEAAVRRIERLWGRIDILHNNVGISLEGGDAPLGSITSDALDRLFAINLRGMILTCKHAIPSMVERKAGAIVNILR